MNLKFNNPEMYQYQDAFNELLPDSLTMNQYELAEATMLPAEMWSAFLRDGQVAKHIESEVSLILKTNQAKLVSSAADNERSVGAAQMLNAMSKLDAGDKPETNFFIYSFIPPTEDEMLSPTTRVETDWTPPVEIVEKDEEVEELIQKCAEEKTAVPEVKDNPTEVDEDDWF